VKITSPLHQRRMDRTHHARNLLSHRRSPPW
jgi:hypothetical protein